ELSLVRKSNISITEMGSSVDNYKDGFVIPLIQIKKAYSTKIQKIYVVVIETRDGLSFSVTMANNRSIGRLESINLSEMINSTILLAVKASKNTQNVDDYVVKPPSNKCANCGEVISHNWRFCKNCGREL
ncbi:MAG: double zinc ribbon domain-containing protein, partial [Promethearchaeota archaeon]